MLLTDEESKYPNFVEMTISWAESDEWWQIKGNEYIKKSM